VLHVVILEVIVVYYAVVIHSSYFYLLTVNTKVHSVDSLLVFVYIDTNVL